jgi:hypothetical protein
MPLQDELADLYDNLLVGCLQISRFHELSARLAAEQEQDAVPDQALGILEQFLRESSEPALSIELEETGNTLTLTREEAGHLHRLTHMGLDVEVRYLRIANNMMLIYLTTLFEGYLVDSARAVLESVLNRLRYPSVPRRERMAWSESANDLMVRLVRRQITDLGFRSFQAKMRFVERTLGVDLRAAPSTPADIGELYATRNLLVHSGGAVTPQYVSAVRGTRLSVGERREVDDGYLRAAITTVQTTGEYLSSTLVSRYAGVSPGERLEKARALTERLNRLITEDLD